MELFIINKARFEIVERHWPYAIIRSLKTGGTFVYKIGGCKQYGEQFNSRW